MYITQRDKQNEINEETIKEKETSFAQRPSSCCSDIITIFPKLEIL